MSSLAAVLDDTVTSIDDHLDPYSLDSRDALLLAAHAASRRAAAVADSAAVAGWDFCTQAIRAALAELREQSPDDRVLAPTVVDCPVGDLVMFTAGLTALIARLATFYATAAASEAGSPWRRLTWAGVAYHLDQAMADVP
jgi:hypothetical protein